MMTNSDARKRAQEAASNSKTATGATNSPSASGSATEPENGALGVEAIRVLLEAAGELRTQAVARFDRYGGGDARGAALWDAACHLDPHDGNALNAAPTPPRETATPCLCDDEFAEVGCTTDHNHPAPVHADDTDAGARLSDDERADIASNLRWDFACHAAEPDKSYDSLGIENAILRVEALLARHRAEAAAEALERAASDPTLRLSEHSGISETRLLARANAERGGS